jgi:hypothetical protein
MRIELGTEIAEILNRIPEARWDRFIDNDDEIVVYGWLEREDRHADFLLIIFGLNAYQAVSWYQAVTSSAALSQSIAERLVGREVKHVHVPCQRVDEHLGDLVPNTTTAGASK